MSDAIQELAQQLSSEDPSKREAAVRELAGASDPRTVPLLLRALEDPAAPVRRWGAHGLAKLGRSQEAPVLRRLLEKDPSTAVRIQAAFGLARMGEQLAVDKLLLFLDADTLGERRDAAGALVALPNPERLRPRLRSLLTGKDARRRAWAAGVLHALGDAEAFAQWRGTLLSPVSLRDAVCVVPVMREPRATRELLRLLAELSKEEVDATQGGGTPLGALIGDALGLSGLEVLLASPADEAFRMDLVLLLGRYRRFIPELVGDIRKFLTEHFRQELRPDKVMSTKTIEEMPALGLPGSFVTTGEMEALDADAVNEGATFELALPDEVSDEELGEDEDWIYLPPEAEDVAQRALVLGGMMRRLALEERLAKGKDPAAKQECQRLQAWMEDQGLFGVLGATALTLLEAEPGTWSEEDRQMVAWSAEQLQLLLWALKQGKLPPMEARVDPAPLLERLPLGKDSQPFLESAELRPMEEVEAQRGRWDVLLECARYESLARGILADESLAESAPELDALLEAAEAEGFDWKGLQAKRGKARAMVEGLRFCCVHIVTQLQQEGMLPGKPGEGLIFQGKRLMDLDEKSLATLLALSQGRSQALEWISEGDQESLEDDEEFIEDDEEFVEDDEEPIEDDEDDEKTRF